MWLSWSPSNTFISNRDWWGELSIHTRIHILYSFACFSYNKISFTKWGTYGFLSTVLLKKSVKHGTCYFSPPKFACRNLAMQVQLGFQECYRIDEAFEKNLGPWESCQRCLLAPSSLLPHSSDTLMPGPWQLSFCELFKESENLRVVMICKDSL